MITDMKYQIAAIAAWLVIGFSSQAFSDSDLFEFPKDRFKGDWVQDTDEFGSLAVDIRNNSSEDKTFEFEVEDEAMATVPSDQWRSSIGLGVDVDSIILPAKMTYPRTIWFQFKNPGIHYLCLTTSPVGKPRDMFIGSRCRKINVIRESE